jgi:hypothetical protein
VGKKKRYVIQYQYLQNEEWYDDPAGKYSDTPKGAKAQLEQSRFRKAAKMGVRYRIVKRETTDTPI